MIKRTMIQPTDTISVETMQRHFEESARLYHDNLDFTKIKLPDRTYKDDFTNVLYQMYLRCCVNYGIVDFFRP